MKKINTILAYDSPSWFYDMRGFFILHLTYRSGIIHQILFFSKNIGKKHLEVAVGSGTLFLGTLLFKKYFRAGVCESIDAFDYVPRMLNGSKKLTFLFKEVNIFVGDVTQINAKDGSYSTINVANSIHSFDDVPASLKEMHRVLENEGNLYFNALLYPSTEKFLDKISSQVNAWGKKKGILVSPFSEEEITDMVKRSGFTLLSKKRHGNSLHVVAKK